MISKAKILFYGMFRRPKNAVPTEVKKLNFLNKLILLQVGRFNKYRNIPKTVSIFEWQESKRRAWKQYRIIGYCLIIYAIIDLSNLIRMRRLDVSKKLYEERRAKNLPDHPLVNVFGENKEFDAYRTDFLTEKYDSYQDMNKNS